MADDLIEVSFLVPDKEVGRLLRAMAGKYHAMRYKLVDTTQQTNGVEQPGQSNSRPGKKLKGSEAQAIIADILRKEGPLRQRDLQKAGLPMNASSIPYHLYAMQKLGLLLHKDEHWSLKSKGATKAKLKKAFEQRAAKPKRVGITINPEQKKQQILTALKKSHVALNQRSISKASGIKVGTVDYVLKKLLKDGAVLRDEKTKTYRAKGTN